MTMKLIRPLAFTATLPLKEDQVAAQLANTFAANTYLDGLQSGLAVGVDTDGTAKVADDATTDVVGFIVEDAKANGMANFHCLANKQITYVSGPTEVTIDNVTPALTYTPGDKLYVTTGGLLTNNDNAGALTIVRGTVLVGRASGSTDPITVKLH